MGEKIDLLFCNQQEALSMCGTQDIESTKQCLQQYAKTFVITLGKKGSIAFDGKEYFHAHSVVETAIDSLGAGDNFAGGFLYALARGYNYESANKLANIVAGRVVSKFGPRIDETDAKFILNEMVSL
jgi:sugar/nucleoside kinase (ribokinase family)